MPAIRLRLEETPRYKDAGSATPFRISTNTFWIPGTSGQLAPGPQHLDRSDEITGVLAPRPKEVSGFAPSGRIPMRVYPNQMVPLALMAGLQTINSTPIQGTGTNEVQTITPGGSITGGTWTWTFGGVTSDPIPYNASNAVIQAILENMSNIEAGDVTVAGGPLPGVAITVTFKGQYAATNVAQATTGVGALTGSSPTLTVSTTTSGVVGAAVLPSGQGLPSGSWMWQFGPRTGNVPKTATIDLSYDSPWTYGSGMAVSSLSVSNDGQVSADMVGLDVGRYLVDPSLSPSYDAETVKPLMPKDMVAGWAAGGGPVSSLSWTLSNGLEVRNDQGRRTEGRPGRIYLAGYPSINGSIDSTEFDQDDWDLMMSAATFSVTQTWRGPSQIASTGMPYMVILECPACQITDGGPEDLQAKRMHGATWGWEAKLSAALGYSFRLTLVNAVSAAETYV